MPPKKRSTWEVQASIPVLYTHQKVAKRPVHKEGHLRLNAGKAVLCDANGKRLDEDTVTSSLLQQLSSGEELDFPGHLLSPDPPDAAKVALSNAMAVPTRTTATNVSPRAGPLGASAASARGAGATPSMPPVAKKKFKRPRLLEAPAPTEPEREEFHEGPEIAERAIPPKEQVNDMQPAATPTPTPCRNELRGVKGPFKVPRPQSLWTTLQEVPEATFPGVQLPPQAVHPPAAPAPAADPPDVPDPSGDTTLELCRKALMTERRNLERNSADSLSDDEIFLTQAASVERERRAQKTQVADFLPDVENCFESTKGIVVKSLMSQRSKETQRPSFYNFDVPEGPSQEEALAPNRLLHEMRQDEMKFFMGRLQVRPKWLSQKVSKKRQELLVKDNHPSCLGRVWASFVERFSS